MNPLIEYIIIGTITGWAGLFLFRKIYSMFQTPKDDSCGGSCGCAAGELKKGKKISG
jgi:hypothetical protein